MLRLVIGGYAQGKLAYVLAKYGLSADAAWDGAQCGTAGKILPEELVAGAFIFNHFHSWMKERLRADGNPEEEIFFFLDRCKDCIIICDEIGNGIVPADAFEREYRERTGRLLIRLAERAGEVERVVCGIGQRIK